MKMKNKTLSLRILALVVGLFAPASALAADWTVVRMSGDVRIFHNNVTWVALSANRKLMPGDAIWTGRNGRVMLSYDEGRVIVKPRSMIKIPAQSLSEETTVIFQSMGALNAEVNKRDKIHFSIHTPYLAAVVKGTKFSINIDEEQTVLRVTEGTVQAVEKRTGTIIDVLAGQYVAALHSGKGGLFGNAKGAKSPTSGGIFGNQRSFNGNEPGSAGGEGAGNDDSADSQKAHEDNRHRGKGKKLGHSK